jgi:peptidoglycan-N-acetylglucosamine deacetylase
LLFEKGEKMAQFPWPEGQAGAVSLSFDDGMQSQLARAMPILEEFGLRGTFYVNPTETFLARADEWRAAFERGHEIGNHTVLHPCSQNFAFITEAGRRPLEAYGLEEIEAEIVDAGRILAEAIPGMGVVSFAYPCYQPFVGRGSLRQSYVPVVLRHCVAGRGRGETPNDPFLCDVGYLGSFPCERMTGTQMIGLAEEAAALGRWTILTFHGVHEGHLSVADRDLEMLCRHLANRREGIWTPTVAEGASFVLAVQEEAVS